MIDTKKISWILIAAVFVTSALIVIFPFLGYRFEYMYIMLALLFSLLAALLIVILIRRKTEAKAEYDGLAVRGPMLSVRIPYGEITALEMREGLGIMDYGIRIMGYGGVKRFGGSFRNREFGNYLLSVNNSVKKCIIIRRRDKKVLVFNLETADETTDLYLELKKKTGR
jgi:hypothetical protein